MNPNLDGKHPEIVLHLKSAMMRSRFRPGAFVKYTQEMGGDQRVKYRVLGVTLSEDTAGLLGFYYSIQHPTIRTVYHDVAEFELEIADEQHPSGNSHGPEDAPQVPGEPGGSSADRQGHGE